MNRSFLPSFRFWKSIVPALVAAACGGAQAPAPAPKSTPPVQEVPPPPAPVDPLAEPPPPGITPDAPFPTITHRELENGMKLRVVSRSKYPIVELSLVILSGQATDEDEPGVALLAGEMLKVGGAGAWDARALVERAESLGANLEVLTDRDATRVTIGVTTGDFDAALEILGALAQRPRFAPIEFTKLKQRELERVRSLAKGNAAWAASMLLYRELYELPTSIHPYARYDVMPSDLEKLTLESAKRWYRKHFTPKNAVLVVAGDIDADRAEKAARRVLGAWRGEKPPPTSFTAPLASGQKDIFVVDRPGTAQAQIFVAGFGPERDSAEWPALATANQILGGGVSGRLFMDVREKRSLAYSTGSSLDEPAHGPAPIILSAGTQTPKAAEALQALLDNFAKMSASAPSDAEVQVAARYLSDSFLFRTETVGAIAGLTTRLLVLGLPDDYYDTYRKAVRNMTAAQIHSAAQRYYRPESALVVVAGDAQTIAKPLTRFGKVTIVDPERAFAPVKQLASERDSAPSK